MALFVLPDGLEHINKVIRSAAAGKNNDALWLAAGHDKQGAFD